MLSIQNVLSFQFLSLIIRLSLSFYTRKDESNGETLSLACLEKRETGMFFFFFLHLLFLKFLLTQNSHYARVASSDTLIKTTYGSSRGASVVFT